MASVSNKFLVAVLALFVLVACVASAQGTNCQVPNCLMCTSTSEFQCQMCMTGFVAANNQCTPPTYCGVTNCALCVSGNPSRCASCDKGYRVAANGYCAKTRRNAAAAPAAAMWAAAAAVAVAVAYAL